MPFTISHAAVVLPFSRLLARWRLLSAVVIGAMVPDFGLFFPWRVHRFETHSAMALLTFCLPVGLVTYWAFQYLVKTPICTSCPTSGFKLIPSVDLSTRSFEGPPGLSKTLCG